MVLPVRLTLSIQKIMPHQDATVYEMHCCSDITISHVSFLPQYGAKSKQGVHSIQKVSSILTHNSSTEGRLRMAVVR